MGDTRVDATTVDPATGLRCALVVDLVALIHDVGRVGASGGLGERPKGQSVLTVITAPAPAASAGVSTSTSGPARVSPVLLTPALTFPNCEPDLPIPALSTAHIDLVDRPQQAVGVGVGVSVGVGVGVGVRVGVGVAVGVGVLVGVGVGVRVGLGVAV